VPTRNTLTGVRIVHTRHTLLGAERTLEEATLDKYAYVRDFYLEQRRYKVSDGKRERVYEDFDDLSASPLGDESMWPPSPRWRTWNWPGSGPPRSTPAALPHNR